MAYKRISPQPVVEGGTGAQTLTGLLIGNATAAVTGNLITNHNVLVGGASNAVTSVAPSTTGNPLVSGGASSDPLFSATPIVNAITINNAPSASTDGTNKAYVDAIASGITFVTAVKAATTPSSALSATYNNGTAGVGATLTNNSTQVALALDGVSLSVSDRVLIKDFVTPNDPQNGVYSVTTVGSGSTNWVLTRTTDYDDNVEIHPGTLIPVAQGTLNGGSSWIETATVTTVGTDPILFAEFSFGPSTFLQVANNLSDVNSASASRANLGLTAVAIQTVTPHDVLVGGAANAITSVSPSTSGYVLTSNGVSADPSFQPAAAAPAFTWTVVTGATQALTANNGYFANRAGIVTFTLPSTAAVGDTFQVAQMHAGQTWVLNYNSGQKIYIGTTSTTTSSGNLTSTADGDWIEIVCRVANTDFQCNIRSGNILPA